MPELTFLRAGISRHTEVSVPYIQCQATPFNMSKQTLIRSHLVACSVSDLSSSTDQFTIASKLATPTEHESRAYPANITRSWLQKPKSCSLAQEASER